jgi:Biopolymer transport proteins
MSGWELFQKGGPVMYLLLFCSLATVGIAIERVMYYREMKRGSSQEFLERLTAFFRAGDWSAASEQCEGQGGLSGAVVLKAVRAIQAGENLGLTLDTEYTYLTAKLKENLRYLSAIVTIAPLLGLLGTVIGMISSFSIFSIESGQPMAITDGIGEALIATATGLLVAVLAFLVFLVLSKWQEELSLELEQTCGFLEIQLEKHQMRG